MNKGEILTDMLENLTKFEIIYDRVFDVWYELTAIKLNGYSGLSEKERSVIDTHIYQLDNICNYYRDIAQKTNNEIMELICYDKRG